MTVVELGLMPNAEYVQWRAYYVYKHAMEDMAARVAAARMRRHG